METKNLETINLSKEERGKALKLIDDILHSMSFFRQNIAGWDLQKDEVKTFMGLFESYFTELSPIVSYDSVLVQERKKRNEKIRELNQKVSNLQSLAGKAETPASVNGFLKNCDDIFRAWYGSYGFHYASLREFTFHGAVYELSDELGYDADDGLSSMKELAKKIRKTCIIITDQEGWNITRDKYHATLLDTDTNKHKLKSLLLSHFPECDVREYRSRKNDYGSYSIRTTMFIPYSDLCRVVNKYED